MRWSPGCLRMRSLSPVRRLSFTLASPETTTASAGIWSPRPSFTRSSCTICSRSSSTSTPSRTTTAFLVARSVSLSTMRLERSACTTPMPVFSTTMPKKPMFFHEPVASTKRARTRLMRLKMVKRFSAKSSRTDLVLMPVLTLTLPVAMRCSTSAEVRPRASPTGSDMGPPMARSRSRDSKSARTGGRYGRGRATLVPRIGFEPTAFCSGGRRSNPLS